MQIILQLDEQQKFVIAKLDSRSVFVEASAVQQIQEYVRRQLEMNTYGVDGTPPAVPGQTAGSGPNRIKFSTMY